MLRVCFSPRAGDPRLVRGGRLDVLARMGPSRRLLLVTITLLWSFACNCLVTHYSHQDRFYQIVQIFIGDTVGVMVLAALFMFFQSAGLQRFCWRCSRLIHVDCTVVPAMLAGVFLVYLTALILASLTVTELQMAGESFFPIWMTARLTEAFRHGTAWAIMVQYGSSARTRGGSRFARLRRRAAAMIRFEEAESQRKVNGQVPHGDSRV